MSQVSALPTLTRVRHDDEQEPEVRPLDLRLITRLYKYTHRYTSQRNWLFLFVFLRSIQLPSLTWVLAAVIDGPITRGDTAGVWQGGAVFLVLALSTQLVMHYRQRYALELGEGVVQDLRQELFVHLQRMPMSFYNQTKLGRIISRMTSDIENVRVGVQEILFVGIVQLGQMLVAAMFMLWYDRVLFCVVLAMAPVFWAINRIFHRKLSKGHRDVQESYSRVTATLAESVNGIRVTQGFVRQTTNADMFRDLVEDHSRYNHTVARTQGMFLPLLDLNTQAFMALLLLIGGYRVLNPASGGSIGDLVGFFFMANVFFSPISGLGTQYDQALTAMAGGERVFKLLDTPPAWTDPPDAIPLPTVQGHVELRNLNFSYLPGRPVLHDISFIAEPGQTIALVGHTGSGKSSIGNLIAKFYLPDSGELLIDGLDIRQINSTSLHEQIGIVLQQNFLFSGTVLDNIRVGRRGASDDDVRAAARQLCCLDLLEALPAGLQTQVGERGGNLSLGQRQSVCFTRAMLADPRILILDEATSSVDTVTEARVQAALAALVAGRTSFVIAHRLSTVRHADQVLVLNHGRLTERGRHHELLAAGGEYTQLYRRFVQTSRR